MIAAAAIDGWLAGREAAVPGLRPGVAKRVVWAGAPGVMTPLSVVYVHGFSATSEEIRPLPDRIAAALGANLHFTRLTGHGQDGAALGAATFADWRADMDEALTVGQAIGERVLLIGCSTGCTLIHLALGDGATPLAVMFVSPNYALRSPLVRALLAAPGVRRWGPALLGREKAFDPISPDHAAYWTTRYPLQAVFALDDAMRAVRRVDTAGLHTPALFAFSDADQVVSPAHTHAVMRRWGGPVRYYPVLPGPGDDAMAHLVAGDIFSPGQTGGMVAAALDWLRPLV